MEGLCKVWNSLVPLQNENFNISLDEYDLLRGNSMVLADWFIKGILDTVISLSYNGIKVNKYLGMCCGRNTALTSFVDKVYSCITVRKGFLYSYEGLIMLSMSEDGEDLVIELYFENSKKFFVKLSSNEGVYTYKDSSMELGLSNSDKDFICKALPKVIGSVTGLCPIPIKRIECWMLEPLKKVGRLMNEKEFHVGFAECKVYNGYSYHTDGEYVMAVVVGKS